MARTREYTKVARAQAEERTRNALLDAAEKAFVAQRWEDITLAGVAADAGVTKQTLLRHFGSKEGLTAQAGQRALERVSEQRLSAPTDDIDGAVDNLLDHYYAVGERALKIEAMDGIDAIVKLKQRGREFHYAWVEHAFGTWLTGRERARRRAALIAICDVETWSLLSHDLGLPRSEVRATLLLAIRRLLGEDA
jgi:AcrR family transcriptional regulator